MEYQFDIDRIDKAIDDLLHAENLRVDQLGQELGEEEISKKIARS